MAVTSDKRQLTSIGLFSDSVDNIELFDFSSLNLRFVKFRSEEMTTLFKNWAKDYRSTDHNKAVSEFWDSSLSMDQMYALIPIDIKIPVLQEDIEKVRDITLLIFPSSFALKVLALFEIHEKKYLWWSGSISYQVFPYSEDELRFDRSQIKNINRFINIYLGRSDLPGYLSFALQNYLEAYYGFSIQMAYLQLCICLESIVNGETELTYRLRRNHAIINGTTLEESKIIFENINNLYALRSSIVHGEKYNADFLWEYYYPLRNLVSSTIVHLNGCRVQTVKELNDRITETEFGGLRKLIEKKAFSSYKSINQLGHKSLIQPLKKYKPLKK